jgi:chromosome segregation ATPase
MKKAAEMEERAQEAERKFIAVDGELSASKQLLEVEKQRYLSTLEQLQKVEEAYNIAKEKYEKERAVAVEADKAAAVDITRIQTELQAEKQRVDDKQELINKLEEEIKVCKKKNNDLRQVASGIAKRDEEISKLKEQVKELEGQLNSQREEFEVCR